MRIRTPFLDCLCPNTAPDAFTDEDKRMFADPIRYKEFRHALEADMNVRSERLVHCFLYSLLTNRKSAHHLVLRESELQKAVRAACKGYMLQKLAKKPWIADHREHVFDDYPLIQISLKCLVTVSDTRLVRL